MNTTNKKTCFKCFSREVKILYFFQQMRCFNVKRLVLLTLPIMFMLLEVMLLIRFSAQLLLLQWWSSESVLPVEQWLLFIAPEPFVQTAWASSASQRDAQRSTVLLETTHKELPSVLCSLRTLWNKNLKTIHRQILLNFKFVLLMRTNHKNVLR